MRVGFGNDHVAVELKNILMKSPTGTLPALAAQAWDDTPGSVPVKLPASC